MTEQELKSKKIGFTIHNNSMKVAIRNYEEFEKLRKHLEVVRRCRRRMEKMRDKESNFFQHIIRIFSSDRRWFIIQDRIIKISEEAYQIAIKHDRTLFLARYNKQQSDKLK